MTKEEILEYIKHTPANSNIAVLSDMLDGYSGGSSSSGGLYVGIIGEPGVLDHTWQEIHNAFPFVVVPDEEDPEAIMAVCMFCAEVPGEGYGVIFNDGRTEKAFLTDSPDGYPVMQIAEGGYNPGIDQPSV